MSNQKKVLLYGACGQMGRRIYELLKTSDIFTVDYPVESTNCPGIGVDYGEYIGEQPLGAKLSILTPEVLQECDIVIDFSNKKGAADLLFLLKKYPKPLVSGTTGMSEDDASLRKEIAEHVPVMYAPNMSTGVNIMFAVAKQLAAMTKDFDVEITEIHHNKKKDAPSGTATKLKDIVVSEREKIEPQNIIYGREGISDIDKPKNEIAVHALRGGDVVGEHTVFCFGDGERLEFSHRALSRDIFVRGAIKAAHWLIEKKAGLYTMSDVILS